MSGLRRVSIYTDGACVGNPGRGGWAAVLLHGERRRELSGGYRLTTNNRMELAAPLFGLRALKFRCAVTVFSDSKYVVDGVMKGWARHWRASDWRRPDGEKALNPDLWDDLLAECDRHLIEFAWVPGHSGVADNERCDRLANEAALADDLPVDVGFEDREAVEAKLPRQPTLFDGLV
jgi:ribonuclease HI